MHGETPCDQEFRHLGLGDGWRRLVYRNSTAQLAMPCAIRPGGDAARSAVLSGAKKAPIVLIGATRLLQEPNPDCPIEDNAGSFNPYLDEVNQQSGNFKRTSSPRKRGSSDFRVYAMRHWIPAFAGMTTFYFFAIGLRPAAVQASRERPAFSMASMYAAILASCLLPNSCNTDHEKIPVSCPSSKRSS